jgi:site-specific DNA recombinase
LTKSLDKLYLDDQISKAGFGKRYKPMEERLSQIDEQIPALEGQIDYLKSQYLSEDEVLHEARYLYSRWTKLKREEKRQIIETITEKNIIGQKDITINLCYLPSPSKSMAERGQSRMNPNPW